LKEQNSNKSKQAKQKKAINIQKFDLRDEIGYIAKGVAQLLLPYGFPTIDGLFKLIFGDESGKSLLFFINFSYK
jgi:hypothetical protein